MRYVLLFSATLIACSCSNHKQDSGPRKQPAPGTVVAKDQMPVTNDDLSKFMFSIKVVADSYISRGVYDVQADFGPNSGMGQFTMPRGGEDLPPVIRKGSAPNTWVIGFMMPDDTTFYDYFEVSANKHTTEMKYIKSYTF